MKGFEAVLAEETFSAMSFALVGVDSDFPLESAWLTPTEQSLHDGMRVAKRRRDWLAGRRAGKLAVGKFLGSVELSRIEILPGPNREPVVSWAAAGEASLPGVSISHSGGLAGAIAFPEGRRIGFDVEHVEPVTPAVYSLAFTKDEIAAIEGQAEAEQRLQLVLRMWTAKEAVLKAMKLGLQVAMQSVQCGPATGGVFRRAWLTLPHQPEREFAIHSTMAGGYIFSIASEGDHPKRHAS